MQLEETIQLLKLDENQVANVRTILEYSNAQRIALVTDRQNGPGRIEGMRAVNDSTVARLTTVLTAEQLEVYKKILNDQRRGRRRR